MLHDTVDVKSVEKNTRRWKNGDEWNQVLYHEVYNGGMTLPMGGGHLEYNVDTNFSSFDIPFFLILSLDLSKFCKVGLN